MDTLGLLVHPVRLRIVFAMSGGQTRTTSDLCARLPDVPKTSVYRHVGVLADAGVLEVAREERVRGAVERHYRLRHERAAIGADVAAAMSLDDHRRAFAVGMAAVLAEFNSYLDRPGADPTADRVGYRQGVLWLRPDELTMLIDGLRSVLRNVVDNEPTPDRSPHLVTAIFFPAGEETPHTR
ncbi:helix-turn-helix protein [Pseudonocardia hierapolitana]|uniref:Helix-turn-helix protein n=1 Tax=Pseudonocardia hierapolitana TaxID=1128676 RepID=A0A561T069_9PSEU|nr:helix-turn-helix domain-containing protein [Pseudonocardia hierapolitana]TWF80510.1 helix-turn-helix protein [Pseudonocardia hierapolitana]